MENIIFNGPFSMPIMEDSTNLAESIVEEVCQFARDQYRIELDHLNYSVCSQIDLDQEPNRHKHKTVQKLVIKQKGDKFYGHLVIKSKLECS